jgi:wyosine [tRNA(Phe)-imidazoG37] synthetase (radical SAM superfamily)
MSISFGPVPSRRLGQSLGINNIPPKHCSYSCVYCQVGPTPSAETERREFYTPDAVFADVSARVVALRERGEAIDYLTFVPDGEPTLDLRLGEHIERLRPLDIPIAVISNASLLWQPEVREALNRAAWVSVKVDAARQATWRRINRPASELQHELVIQGMLEFSTSFQGQLATETMLVRDINDSDEDLRLTAGLISKLAPAVAYIGVPTRPCAVPSARPAETSQVLRAHELLSAGVEEVCNLADTIEPGHFAVAGELADELLRITAVHPMTQRQVEQVLERDGADWSLVESLLQDGKLRKIAQHGTTFYFNEGSP